MTAEEFKRMTLVEIREEIKDVIVELDGKGNAISYQVMEQGRLVVVSATCQVVKMITKYIAIYADDSGKCITVEHDVLTGRMCSYDSSQYKQLCFPWAD